ncbi:MarR family winged helix-turn-helix transcriptional regulator [Ferviditalea candida]|uniref:MarR family transcriptional regulator n=1 Tax=Ferviditalea candida TaxID=3108399 RepID=A0ABU5ZN25_9BACL|nr:MarR family transcriptional regulator [Paenibacillaceae bacterium T2]
MNSAYTPLIHVIRRFNRFYTNILGLLDQHLPDSEFSLSEALVLYEIGHTENSTAKKLIEELKIDPGYLSRIIKRFERHSLIYREQSGEDGRVYYLYLTDRGKDTLSKLNELSDSQIRQIIGGLSEQDQTNVVESMGIIAKTLSRKSRLIETRVNIRCELKPGDVDYLIHLYG